MLYIVIFVLAYDFIDSLLPVQNNEFREIKCLNGLWKFKVLPSLNTTIGFDQNWYDYPMKNFILMPVPSSYNDITLDSNIRNFLGWAWYQTEIYIPPSWITEYKYLSLNNIDHEEKASFKYILRFESVNYYAMTWIDGVLIGSHEVAPHLLTVAVNNTLTHFTIPQADIHRSDFTSAFESSTYEYVDKASEIKRNRGNSFYPSGYIKQQLLFDFFNYAGIHRNVYLIKVRRSYIADVSVKTVAARVFMEKIKRLEDDGPKWVYDYDVVDGLDMGSRNVSSARIDFDVTVNGISEEELKTYDWTCTIAIRGDPEKSSSSKYLDPILVNLSRYRTHPNDLDRQDDGFQSVFFKQTVLLEDVQFWWPQSMIPDLAPGFLYTARVTLMRALRVPSNGIHLGEENRVVMDVYTQPFGVRSLEIKSKPRFVKGTIDEALIGSENGTHRNDTLDSSKSSPPKTRFLVNGLPFYFRGFGWHEDSPIRGRGHDPVYTVSDFDKISWLGANSFRTSHYPYDESVMDMCDRMGIVVINELPAVGVRYFNDKTLALHTQMAKELYSRDKNRPSTFLWSLANEPRSALNESKNYFKSLSDLFHILDPRRFVTAAIYEPTGRDLIGKYLDVICFNRYHGWYEDTGELELITPQMTVDINSYGNVYAKPIIITEYGSETIPGYHSNPPLVFSEEFQVEFIKRYHRSFDKFRNYKPKFTNNHFNLHQLSNNAVFKHDTEVILINRVDDYTFGAKYHMPDVSVDNSNGLAECFEKSNLIDEPEAQHSNLVGEMIWNFADFETDQTITRVGGNRKGIFTRDSRSPKMASHTLRKRYWSIAKEDQDKIIAILSGG
ncbi:beta-glucuronidase-like isoform X2 [Gordionus sp. m RMFG-2023]|uniref:beta-glucuronidase-like isoform X2 n=1 Tax=Gordionus sp. m RMFG-2023 TaxID=3053472 RepID=UPI0031FCFFE1